MPFVFNAHFLQTYDFSRFVSRPLPALTSLPSAPALTLFEDLHQLRMLSLERLGLTAPLRRLFPSRGRCTPFGGKIRLHPL